MITTSETAPENSGNEDMSGKRRETLDGTVQEPEPKNADSPQQDPSYGNVTNKTLPEELTEEERPEAAGYIAAVCVLGGAIGISLPWTAVLSGVSFFSKTVFEDDTIFLAICFAIYIPSVPIVLLQTFFDLWFDQRFTSKRAYWFRAVVSYSFLTGACIAIVYSGILSERNQTVKESLFIIIIAVMGVFSSILFGTLQQLISFVPFKNQMGASFLMFGYQGSGVIVLLLTYIFSFFTAPTNDDIRGYFFTCAVLEFICIFPCVLMMRRTSTSAAFASKDFEQSASEIFSKPREDSQLLLTTSSTEDSYKDVFWKCYIVLLAEFLNIAMSIFLLPFYSHVPVDSLAQVLVFVKLFSDTLGRPAAQFWRPIKTPMGLLLSVLVRFAFIPVFILYTKGMLDIGPVWIAIMNGIFSFLSGFLGTLQRQCNPTLVSGQINQTKAANLLNISFQLALVISLLIAWGVSTLVYS